MGKFRKVFLLISVISAGLSLGWVSVQMWHTMNERPTVIENSWAISHSNVLPSAETVQTIFEQLSARHAPAVVQLQYIRHDDRPFGPDVLSRYFLEPDDQTRHPLEIDGVVVGSGFVISEDGYIATTSHLLNYTDEVHVILHDDTRLVAEVVGMDPATDVALLKVDAFELPVIPAADSVRVMQGQWLLSIGTPMEPEFSNSLTLGIVSAISPAVQLTPEKATFATDAALTYSQSGAPLLNSQSELIGMVNVASVENRSVFSEAILIQTVMSSAERIIAQRDQMRGRIGLQYTPVAQANFPEGAAHIVFVQPGSAADAAGIRSGDVVLAIDGSPLVEDFSFSDRIASSEPGDVVTLNVQRNGKAMEINVEVDEVLEVDAPDPDEKDPQKRLMSEMGFTVDNLSDELIRDLRMPIDEGVVVLYVSPSSTSYREGDLRGGMIIIEMADKKIRDMKEFMRVYNEIPTGMTFLVLVHRPQTMGAMLTALTKP